MTIGGETFEAMEDLADSDVKNSQEMALRTADKLLQVGLDVGAKCPGSKFLVI